MVDYQSQWFWGSVQLSIFYFQICSLVFFHWLMSGLNRIRRRFKWWSSQVLWAQRWPLGVSEWQLGPSTFLIWVPTYYHTLMKSWKFLFPKIAIPRLIVGNSLIPCIIQYLSLSPIEKSPIQKAAHPPPSPRVPSFNSPRSIRAMLNATGRELLGHKQRVLMAVSIRIWWSQSMEIPKNQTILWEGQNQQKIFALCIFHMLFPSWFPIVCIDHMLFRFNISIDGRLEPPNSQ